MRVNVCGADIQRTSLRATISGFFPQVTHQLTLPTTTTHNREQGTSRRFTTRTLFILITKMRFLITTPLQSSSSSLRSCLIHLYTTVVANYKLPTDTLAHFVKVNFNNHQSTDRLFGRQVDTVTVLLLLLLTKVNYTDQRTNLRNISTH